MRARRGARPGRGGATSTAASAAPARTTELRYEALVESPHAEADRIAGALGSDAGAAAACIRRGPRRVARPLAARPRRPEQLADIEAEAGAELAELGYP